EAARGQAEGGEESGDATRTAADVEDLGGSGGEHELGEGTEHGAIVGPGGQLVRDPVRIGLGDRVIGITGRPLTVAASAVVADAAIGHDVTLPVRNDTNRGGYGLNEDESNANRFRCSYDVIESIVVSVSTSRVMARTMVMGTVGPEDREVGHHAERGNGCHSRTRHSEESGDRNAERRPGRLRRR